MYGAGGVEHATERESRHPLGLREPPRLLPLLREQDASRRRADGIGAGCVEASSGVPLHVWQGLADALARADDSAALSSIRARTLLVWGEHDPISTHDEQRGLVAAIPDARLQVLDGVGHAPHWEDPARVAAVVRDFLAGA